MKFEKYLHCDNDDSYISLHDCYANKIYFNDNVLSFRFDNGFWIIPEHEFSDVEETVRTDKSRVNFHLEDSSLEDVSIYIYRNSIFGKTLREELPLDKLISLINEKNYRLEFIYQYKSYNDLLFECWLWFDKKPYHYECQLKIPTSKAIYCWNNLCKDKKW